MDERQPRPAAIEQARIRHHAPWSAVWIVPLVAAIIALYMAWHSYSMSGPVITITFNTSEGIVVGQTQIKYRAVNLGTVSDIRLDPEFKKVVVKAKMTLAAKEILTGNAQFWIVRPRLTPGNLSGIETLVSGSYIQCDPGAPGGEPTTSFNGLEDPPATRSDEHGTTFQLKAERLGAIGKGSGVYFRDINVGEVLNYDIGNGYGPILLTVFVRAPYDKMVNRNTRFWNTSSLMVNVGPTGLQVQLQSLQALLSGGIAFYTYKPDAGPVEKSMVFTLFPNRREADLAEARKPIAFISYFDGSLDNIDSGAPVYIKGIQVGEVTGVKLVLDYDHASVKVQARFTVQPERAFLQSKADSMDPLTVVQHLVSKGLRVSVESGGLLPGQSGLSLEFLPDAPPAVASMEGESILLPSAPGGGGFEAVLNSVSRITAKLNQIPFEQIGNNLNALLSNANGTVKGLDPNSDFQNDTRRTLDQVEEAARAVRLLADYLSRHPEAIIRGRDTKDQAP